MSDEGRAFAKLFSPLKGGRWLFHYAVGDLVSAGYDYVLCVSDDWLIREWPGLTRDIIARARGDLLTKGFLTLIAPPHRGKSGEYRFEFPGHPEMKRSAGKVRNLQAKGPQIAKVEEPHLLIEPEVKHAPSARSLLFDAVAEAWGVDPKQLTSAASGRIASVLDGLLEVDATPEEVRSRAARWRQRFPQSTLTPQSLERDWPTLGSPRSQRAVKPPDPTVFYDPEGNEIAKPD